MTKTARDITKVNPGLPTLAQRSLGEVDDDDDKPSGGTNFYIGLSFEAIECENRGGHTLPRGFGGRAGAR